MVKKGLLTPNDSAAGCTESLTLQSEAFQNIFSFRLLQRLKWSLSAHAFGGVGVLRDYNGLAMAHSTIWTCFGGAGSLWLRSGGSTVFQPALDVTHSYSPCSEVIS